MPRSLTREKAHNRVYLQGRSGLRRDLNACTAPGWDVAGNLSNCNVGAERYKNRPSADLKERIRLEPSLLKG